MAEPTTETVPNPLIVQDDAERAEAQTVIDNTPDAVKEHVDNGKARDIADLDFNSPDIDGGNIDGTTIGATTPAAGFYQSRS